MYIEFIFYFYSSDPRRVIVTEFRVMFDPTEGHDDIVYNLDTVEGIADLKSRGVTMKEGCKYKFKISFRVQHEIVAGIKFVNTVKKVNEYYVLVTIIYTFLYLLKAVFSETEELMLGSYPPASVPHVFEFPRHSYIEAPKGMLYRGKYYSKNQFIDSDGANHLQYEYELQIKKSWAE